MADSPDPAATAPPLRADELEWEALTREGVEAYGAGRRAEAVLLWRRAAGRAATFADGDPRRAAGDNNLAVAHWIEGDAAGAEDALRRAIEGWRAAEGWIDRMEVRGSARSSLFHHRLETRHRDQFRVHLRRRFRSLCDGGAAATAFNLGALLLCTEDGQEHGDAESAAAAAGRAAAEAARLIGEAVARRAAAFGPRDPALSGMLAVLAALGEEAREEAGGAGPAADGLAERQRAVAEDPARPALQRWIEDRPPTLDDERRALAAAYLACPVDPSEILPADARPGPDRSPG